MPNPFAYDTPANPYVGQIGQLLQQQGTIAGNRARQAGDIWGRTAQQVGQTVAGAVQAQADPQRQLAQEQLAAVQRQNRARNLFDAALRNPANLNPDGSVNDAAVGAFLKKNNVDAWQQWETISATTRQNAANAQKLALDLQNAQLTQQEKTAALAKIRAEYLGGLAFQAEQEFQKNPTDANHARDTFTAALARGVADGALDPKQAHELASQVAAASPEQIAQFFGQFVTPAMRDTHAKAAADVAKTQAETAKTTADTTRVAAETKAIELNGGPTPVALQSENVMYKGKPEQVTFNPRTGRRTWTDPATGQAVDVTGKTTPVPPAAVQSNAQNALSDKALDQAARKYLETGQLPAGQGGMAQRTAIQNRAAEIDPTAALGANQAFFKAQSANLTNLQKTEGTLSAFENTAGKNLDQFLALAEKIPDTGVPWLNMPVRMLNKQLVGSEHMAAIDAARDVALREIARVTNDPKLSGVLSDSARHEVAGLSPTNATLPQIRAVAKVLKQDMANVHTGINQQIDAVRQSIGAKGGAEDEADLIWDGAKLVPNPKKKKGGD